MIAKLRNVGEACTAANRFHVHESLAAEFAKRMAERMTKLKVGRGTEPDVDIGPLIDDRQRGIVEELVQDAVQKGARLLCGGERLAAPPHPSGSTTIGASPPRRNSPRPPRPELRPPGRGPPPPGATSSRPPCLMRCPPTRGSCARRCSGPSLR